MTEWIEYKLEDIAEVTMGQSPKSEFYNTEGKGRPFLQGNRTFGRRFPTFDTWTTKMTKEAKAGDVIMSVRAPVGDLNITPTDMCLGRGVCGIRMKNGKQNFLYYLMKYSIPQLLNMETGTIFGSVNRNDINGLRVLVPDEETQDKVTAYLKNIDDKIETNEAINRNLQEQAQALFKSWFVDLEPFDGEVPEEWTTGVLKDVLQLRKDGIKAGENTELPYLPIDVIPMNDLSIKEVKQNEEAQSSLITFNKNDILIGAMRVYFHRVVIAPFDGITRSTCFVLRPYDEEYLSFGLLCCNQNSSIEYAQSTSKGSTMPYAVWDNGFGDMEIVIPDKKTAKEFNEIIKPMLAIIQKSFFEIQRLQNLRDSLLPKLMSGELDVSDLDI